MPSAKSSTLPSTPNIPATARGMRLNLSFSVPKKGVPLNSEVRISGYSTKTNAGEYMTPDEAEAELNDFVAVARRTIEALRKEGMRTGGASSTNR